MKISKFLFSTLVAAAAMTSTAFAEGTTLYVDASYTEETEGFGETKFKNYSSALNAATDGDKIIVSGEHTYSSVYIGKTDSEIDVEVVFDGASSVNVWSENFRIDSGSLANVVGGSTIKFPTAPVRGILNIGSEAGSVGTANGKGINIYGEEGAETAAVNVYAGSKLVVDSTTTEAYVGHGSNTNRKGELNVYGGTVEFKNLKTNKETGLVNVRGGVFKVANALTNNGTFTVSGNSTLNIATLSGNKVQIISDTTLSDSTVGGAISVGFDNENEVATTLSLAGTTNVSTLYVGKEGRDKEYKLSVSGEDAKISLGNLYNRAGSMVEISDNANVEIGYWQSKGSVLIDNATVVHTGVNMYVYDNDTTAGATIALKNGATLTSKGSYAIYLGNSENGPAKGNAKITLESGSALNAVNLTLHETGTVEELSGVAAETGVTSIDSTINIEKNLTVGKGASLSLTDSTLTAGTVINNGNINIENGTLSVKSFSGSGRVVANGEFSFSFDSIEDTRLFVGRHYDENGNKVMHDAPEQRSTVNLYSVSGNGITVVSNIFNFNNTDLTLHDDLTVKIPTSGGNNYLFMSNTEINLNGKAMSVGGSFIMTGVNLVGSGTLTIDGNEGYRNATSCTQEISSSIGKESTLIVKNGPFGFYSDMTIDGAFYGENLSHSINIGVNDQGWDADMKPTGKPWIENVKVAVSGTLDVSGSVLVHGSEVSKYDETIQVGPSSLDVVDGGDVKISGQLKNDGILNIGEGSVLTANVITGTGDVVLAGTINVGESLTTGNLTIVAGATLNIGPMVALFSMNTEENSLSFDTLTIVDEEGTLINDNGDLDLSSILSDESSGKSALLSAIKSKASESESESPVVKVQDKNGSVFDVEFTVGENGEISATVVPEPSAFGLLAGLGAIALAVSRRRRSR